MVSVAGPRGTRCLDARRGVTFRYGKRPVVATGGSYSGATCAWFRQAYPDHAAGCISSSGVVDARWDFPEFDEHVAGAIDCTDALRNTTDAMERKFQAGEGDEVRVQRGVLPRRASRGSFRSSWRSTRPT